MKNDKSREVKIPQQQPPCGSETVPAGVTLLAGSYSLSPLPMEPFEKIIVEYLASLSERIRSLSRTEASEEMKALGFWLRQQHLIKLREKYGRPGALGLGISFHIAPSNVPLMFAYTCAIGLLAGNSCRVRISGRRTKEAEGLCRLMEELLTRKEFSALKNRISLLTYESGLESLTEQFSRECDARIIWGGDQTVEKIRRLPLKPSAAELVFPDRTSVCILGAEAVMALSPEELQDLAARFYNDTYGMDQNACSCPRLVFWEEDKAETGRLASNRFWNAVAETAARYELSEIKVSQKYTSLWECAGADEGIVQLKSWKNRLYVLEAGNCPAISSQSRMRFGSFLEYHMKDSGEWTAAISEQVQTLTFFGVERGSLIDTVRLNRLKGVFRIVPVGQALLMDLIWDGKDLITGLSRLIG